MPATREMRASRTSDLGYSAALRQANSCSVRDMRRITTKIKAAAARERVGDAPVTAEDVRELARRDMVMRARSGSLWRLNSLSGVLARIFRHHPLRFVRPEHGISRRTRNRSAVNARFRRRPRAISRRRGTCDSDTAASGSGWPQQRSEPPECFDRFRIVRVEEDDAVDRHADRPRRMASRVV